MFLFFLILPLFSFILLYSCSRWVSSKYLLLFNISCLYFSLCFISLTVCNILIVKTDIIIFINLWFSIFDIQIFWNYTFDYYSSIMLALVLFISLLVHIYSIEYMWNDPYLLKFLSFLSLFTWFMLMFVASSNFCLMFLSWEGVGLTSYLLINYWDSRIRANKSAFKAIIINRISDVFLYFSILLLLLIFKTLDYTLLFSTISLIPKNIYIYSLCFCLIIGAVGKSAQFGLHTWLPDAMEGPTPVSALLHAATMVTAGIFLIIRCFSFFEFVPELLIFMLWFGGCVTFFSGSLGCFTFDLKRIIAFSTCSQLGLMFLFRGCSHYSISFFHLFNHAYFKALLFLCAGVLIHALFDEQDIRRFGSFFRIAPLIYLCFIIGSFAICGFPFLTGFYSKDLLSELSLLYFISINPLFFVSLCSISIFFTSLYTLRLLIYCFLTTVSFSSLNTLHHPDTFYISLFVLFILSICSIFIGFIFFSIFTEFSMISGGFLWSNLFGDITLVDYGLTSILHYLPIFLGFVGSLVSLFIYYVTSKLNQILFNFWSFNLCKIRKLNSIFYTYWIQKILYYFEILSFTTNYKWYFDFIYNKTIAQSFLVFCKNIMLFIDRGFLNFLTVSYFIYLLKTSYYSTLNTFFFNGSIQMYSFLLINLIIYILFFFTLPILFVLGDLFFFSL